MREQRQMKINEMKSNRRIGAAALVAVVLLVGWVSAAHASEPQVGTETLQDARGLGMAGALRASAGSVGALYLNPATMSMARLYHINMKYQYTGRDDLHNGGVQIVDSITSHRLAAGVGVDHLRAVDPHRDFKAWDVRLALSTGIANMFFLGLTGKYLRVENDLGKSHRGPNGPPALDASGSLQANGFTFDAGAALRLGSLVSLGVTGYNLTRPNTVYAPLQLGMGVGVDIRQMLHIEANTVFDFTSYAETGYELSVGAEFFVAGAVGLRAGYRHDFYFDINQIALGAGYNGQRVGLDLAYQQDIEYRDRFRLAFSLRIFIG